MLRPLLLAGCLAVASFRPTCAAPVTQVLFELITLREHGGASGIYPEPQRHPVTPWFAVYSSPSGPNSSLASILTGVSLNRVGQSAIATKATPGFSEFAKLLTDGVEQALHLPYLGRVSERTYFQADSTDEIDLKGHMIDAVKFEIVDWYSETPGRDPNGNGFWTSFYLRQRVTIEGHPVPEPTAASLVVCGTVCIGTRRRRFGGVTRRP